MKVNKHIIKKSTKEAFLKKNNKENEAKKHFPYSLPNAPRALKEIDYTLCIPEKS